MKKRDFGSAASSVIRTAGQPSEKSRRGFLKASVGLAAGVAAAELLPGEALAQRLAAQRPDSAELLQRLTNPKGRAILLKDGKVLSMDSKVGDFAKGDVLIQGKKIISVGVNLAAPAGAIVVDASQTIVMPGFVNTHHHQALTQYRSLMSDSIILELQDRSPGPKNNFVSVLRAVGPGFTPEDAYIAELVASLSQINAGVTTGIDVTGTPFPAQADACIAALKKSGRRTLFTCSGNGPDAAANMRAEIGRLQKRYFSSPDQLLTLAAMPSGDPEQWKVAKSFGVPITLHFWGRRVPLEPVREFLGPDVQLIHFTQMSEAAWRIVAGAGVNISVSPAIDMQMRQGTPPIQKALDFGIRPSLSSDVETNMSADMFTMMRAAYLSQRNEINRRVNDGERDVPPLLTSRDVIDFATVAGAKGAQLESKIGTLTPGKEADIVMLATDRINLFPLNNVPGAIVTLMDTSNVENVFIAGNVVKWQGKLAGVDLRQLSRQIQKSRDDIFARAKYTPGDLFGTCCGGPELPGGG